MAAASPLDAFVKGTKAWFADAEEGWMQGTMNASSISDKAVKLTFTLESGKDISFESTMDKLIGSKFADLPPLKNPPMLEGIDDLSNLSYLHEPAVLHNVKLRYSQQQIYTYSGIVLIAMNPFAKLDLYSPDVMREYSGKRRGELEPHLFAVAEEAYRALIRNGKNQSVIVSGESGAGKTVSAKFIMRYFAIVDDLDKKATISKTSEIEEAVLATNPILESFGNAKTTRNDNSSRFGKYIEIIFSKGKNVKITGAKIRTYLLERSRLIYQPATERNYHIFYQMCAAVPAAEKKQLGLGKWSDYFYLTQGNTGTIPGTDDAAEFAITQQSLSTCGISVSNQWDIFKVCAALLHLGNIKISGTSDAQISDDDSALEQACSLLGIEKSDFKKWIIKKQIITRSEKIVTNINASQAGTVRDSVAKFIYSMLFDWLVKIINKNLIKDDDPSAQFIGVLDIFGFEHFKKNSFEQFCINYANEKLQQEFNQHVFKLDQEEYVKEKISWSFIDFNDNQPCIDLIEGKLGILDLLDEESRLPSGADKSLITKYYQRFGVPTQKFFEKPRFGQTAFTIKHYAVDVTYEIDGFIDKNKDTVSDEHLACLNASKMPLLTEICIIEAPAEPAVDTKLGRAPTSRAPKKPTLGSIFKQSLVSLMSTLRSTEVHYIRCLKPNMAKVSFGFEPQMVLAQLRACGVLETIRISCAGYPSRWTFQEFADRYFLLVKSNAWAVDPKELTKSIVTAVITKDDLYQIGITKIFFRAGQLAFLEKRRSEKLRECVILIQKNMKRHIYSSQYDQMKKAAVSIQTAFRGYRARKMYKEEREKRAVTKLQAAFRRHLAQSQYQKSLNAVLYMQSLLRTAKNKKTLVSARRNAAAIRIQKVFRGSQERKLYKVQQGQIVLLQACIRKRKAVAELKHLKAESKSVGKLKEVNYKLESKVVELSQAVKSRAEEVDALLEKVSQLESNLASWKEKFTRVDQGTKGNADKLAEANSNLKAELDASETSKNALQKENDRINNLLKKKDAEIETLTAESTKYKEESIKYKEEMLKLREDIKTNIGRPSAVAVPSAASTPEATAGVVGGEDPAIAAALRKEIASLREQMSRLIAGKWTRDRVADSLLAVSNAESAAASARPTVGSSMNQHMQMEVQAAIAARPRPVSVNDFAVPLERGSRISMMSKRSSTQELPPDYDSTSNADRILNVLQDKALEDEIIDSLVTNLRIPLPSTQTVATRKEIFFPAHLVGICMTQLLRNNLGVRMQLLLPNAMNAIQNLTMKFEDDYVSAFWLSNCFELLCVVRTIQEREAREQQRRRMQGLQNDLDSANPEKALEQIRSDLDILLMDIYHGWIKELKKRLANMIVPAVIENQSLPGYICKQSGGIWGKWGKSATSSQFTIEQLLNFLSKLSKTMRCYYMEDSMTRQILTELLRVIGVSAFNHILVRKNFCTWKRGVQIQYNVSRLEEWCTTHGIAEATLHLQQLLQAAKLLTLNKTSPQDIETIFDVCFLLNPTQIKKLLSLYYAADFDSPLSPELLKIVANRAMLNEKSDTLLLDLDLAPDFTKPSTRPVEYIDRFIPAWISLPNIAIIASNN
ncbi:Myosin type-2 heavy chain 1 [Physocladia obscura]|uniref:Myosin type-2 heavy chain 1 n=1 Tax=Physocladia obscura TaxID=109957 RepID=A0AAD5XJH0_9FUNG|nr:Myosin type-2 heavy chain 1 [Physocladia obscura]